MMATRLSPWNAKQSQSRRHLLPILLPQEELLPNPLLVGLRATVYSSVHTEILLLPACREEASAVEGFDGDVITVLRDTDAVSEISLGSGIE
jgi:hypothetical protein